MKASIEEQYTAFADTMTFGCYSKMANEMKLQYILNTEEGIDIPNSRKEDYNWLSRNFLIHNKNHPLASVVMELLKQILKK